MCVCVCVCGGRVAVFPSPPAPPSSPFPAFALGRGGGGGASRSGTPGAPAWGPPREHLRPGAAGPAWVPGFSPPGPTLLHDGMLRTTIQGLILCGQEGGNRYSFPAPALQKEKKKKKKSETLRMCSVPANLHRRCVSQSEMSALPGSFNFICTNFRALLIAGRRESGVG